MARLISTNIEGTLNVTGKTTLKDLSAINISGNGTLITNIQWNNIDNKTNVIAGNGLIGGGNLGADITLNIESANDGISVNPDSIQLNSVDNLTTDSATQPLSARQGKNLQDTKVDKTTKINVRGGITGGGSLDKDITITHPGSASSVIERIPNVVTGVSFSNGHVNSIKTYNLDDRYYTESEIDNKFSEISSGLDWKPSVPTYDAILSTYPNPEDGWTVNVDDTDYTYRFTGTAWIAISANSIPLATASVDGKMSKAYASKLDGIAQGANRYVHPNHTGDVTSSGDGATSIVNGKVTNAKLATVSQNTIKGRVSANTGTPEDLTPAQVRTMINVSNGAEVNQPAFSMIKIGAKQALAVSKTDVMEFVAGSNIQLSLDETTKKITITNAYAYTHPVFDAPKFTQSTNTTSANVLYSVTTNNGHVTSGTYKTITPGSNITVETNVAGEIKINNTYKYTHPTGDGNLHVPATGTENNEKFLMAGASEGELLWQAPPLATSIKPGYLKQLTGSTTEFMRADGTWAVPPSVTYNEYIGTFAGLVPNGNSLSSQDKTSKFLRGDGTWQTPYTLPQATSSVLGGVKIGQGINVSAGTISVPNATTSSNGLMISADKVKLDGIETGANKYIHPAVSRTNTTSSTKPAAGGTFTAIDGVTTNAEGHITGVNTKTITMPIADKYVLPPATKTTLGGIIAGDRINVDATGKISIANYEPAFNKNTAFNKSFGSAAGTVSEGNHTHQHLVSPDLRNDNQSPTEAAPSPMIKPKFVANSTDGLSDTGTYHGVITFRPYGSSTDFTGGGVHQLGFTEAGNLWIRKSSSTTAWGAWRKILHEGNTDLSLKVNTSRNINTSGSISGGGNLTADRTITHLTTTGHKHIPSGGASGQLLKWSADGTAVWASVSTSELNALPNPGYGGVHELGRYLDLHMRDSTADYDARIWTDGGQKVCMSGVLAVNSRTIVDASKFTGSTSQTPAISLAIGDSDTGFNWVSDGNVEAWSNNTKLWNLKDVYHTGKKPTKDDVGLSAVNNWGASSDINANSATQYATTSMVAQVRNELVKNPGFIKKIGGIGDSYRKFVIGIVDVSNSSVGRDSHFSGKVIMNRTNGLYPPVMLDVSMSKRYNSESMNFSGLFSGATFSQVTPCTFTYGGKKYGGFDVFISSANVHYVELYGVLNGCHEPIVVQYYDTQNNSIIDQEVSSSINKDAVIYDNSIFKNQYSVYHTGNKPTKDDVGLSNVPNTVHTSDSTASTVVVRDSAADITARLLRTTYANEARLTGAIAFRVNNSTDNYTRYCSDPAAVRAWLQVETGLNSYVKKAGDTMTGRLDVTINAADAIKATRNGYSTMFGCSSTTGDAVFGIKQTTAGDYQDYIRIGRNKLQYQSNGTNYNIYHTGSKPTKADVGLSAVNNWGASSSVNANSTTEYATTNMVAQVKNLIAETKQDVLNSCGILDAETGRNVHRTGVYSYNTNNKTLGDSTPTQYWATIAFGRGAGGSAQIAASWTSQGNELWFRSLRDVTDNWYSWKRIYHTGYKPSSTDVGLGNVNNWGASSSIGANSTSQYATTNMVAQVKALWSNVNNWGASSDANANSTSQYATTAMVRNRTSNLNNWGASSDINANSTSQYATTNMVAQVKAVSTSGIFGSYVDVNVGGNANTYYPVQINLNGNDFSFKTFSVSRGYSWTAPDSWNTATHKGGLTLTMQWSQDGAWGGNDHALRVVQFSEQYTTMVARLELLKVGVVVWLRGGGAQYRINSPDVGSRISAVVHINGFTDSDNVAYSYISSRDQGTVNSSVMARYPVRHNASLYSGNSEVWHRGNFDPNGKMNTSNPSFSGNLTNPNSNQGIQLSNLGFGVSNCFGYGGSWPYETIYTKGNLRFQFSGGERFSMMSNGTFTASSDIVAYSDKRIKTDIEKITNPIDKILKINGYTYNRVDYDKRQAGVLAQEIQNVLPEVVHEIESDLVDDRKLLSVSYGNIVALLIEGIKEQQKQIEELKKILKNKK